MWGVRDITYKGLAEVAEDARKCLRIELGRVLLCGLEVSAEEVERVVDALVLLRLLREVQFRVQPREDEFL